MRVLPSGIQLSIFMVFFMLLLAVSGALTPYMIQGFTGTKIASSVFFKTEYINYPSAFALMNSISLVLILLIPTIIFSYLAHPQPMQYLGFKKPSMAQTLSIPLLALGMLFSILIITQWITKIDLGAWANQLQQDRQDYESLYFKNKSIAQVLINILLVALTPAVCEELFFRSIIMRFLNTWFQKPWLALLISAVLFASVHGSVYNFLPIVLTGLLLAWVYFKTSSIILSILLHFLFNASQVLMVYFGGEAIENKVSLAAQVGFVSVGALLIFIGMKWIQKNKTPLPNNWTVVEKVDSNK